MATGVMTIKYNSSAIRNAANKAAGSFQDAAERVRGVARRLDDMPENSGRRYIRNASAFLRKKEAQYEKKQAALESFASRADTFMDDVKSADKRVADHLEQSLKSFKKITGLSGSVFSTIADFLCKGLKILSVLAGFGVYAAIAKLAIKAGEAIKEWYRNGGKYYVKVLWSALKVIGTVAAVAGAIATIAAGGPVLLMIASALTIVGGAMAGVMEIAEYTKDCSALVLHRKGEAALAEAASKMSGAEVIGNGLADAFGWDAEKTVSAMKTIEFTGNILMIAGGGLKSYSNMLQKYPKMSTLVFKTELKKTFFDELDKAFNPFKAIEGIQHDIKGMRLSYLFTGNAWGADVDNFVDGFNMVKNWLNITVFNEHTSFGEHIWDAGKEVIGCVPVGGEMVETVLEAAGH